MGCATVCGAVACGVGAGCALRPAVLPSRQSAKTATPRASTSRAVPTEACHERRKPPIRKDDAEGCAGTRSSRRTETFTVDAFASETFVADALAVDEFAAKAFATDAFDAELFSV